MNDVERYKREQDLIFHEIEEKERLERQVSPTDEETVSRLGSWVKENIRNDLTRRLMRKQFFRAMSKEQQEEFIQNSIREWKRRTTDPATQI